MTGCCGFLLLLFFFFFLYARVGDSSRRSEEIVKISNCAFQCDHYYCKNLELRLSLRLFINDRIERHYSRFLQSPHCAVNCLQHAQISCKTSSAYRVRHVVYHLARRDSSAIKLDTSWNHIFVSFILLAEPRRGGKRSTRRKPLTTSFRKMPRTKARKFKPQPRLERAL